MIDKETKEIIEIAAYLVAIGEGLARVGGYIVAKVKEKRSNRSLKPSKQRNRRKRQ